MYTKLKIRFISHCRLWANILGSHCVTVWEHNTEWEHCVTVLLCYLRISQGKPSVLRTVPPLWASAPAAELGKPISLTTLPSSEMFPLLVTSRQIRHGPSEASGHLGCPGDLERPETQQLRHPSNTTRTQYFPSLSSPLALSPRTSPTEGKTTDLFHSVHLQNGHYLEKRPEKSALMFSCGLGMIPAFR